MLGRTGRVPGVGHLNWVFEEVEDLQVETGEKGVLVREQNGQRHV